MFGLLNYSIVKAQEVSINANFLLGLDISIGNQNKKITSFVSTFGTIGYNDISIESGLSFSLGKLFKRHTIKSAGLFYGYDFFTLIGIGDNSNLLGSSSSNITQTLVFDKNNKGGFKGLGFGFQKEFLPNKLSFFNQKRGKLILRLSNDQYSFDLMFLNDLNFGRIFNGDGTDFGSTGSLQLGYSRILSEKEIFRTGITLELFTPKANYRKTPNNPINSDDGRKNVWFTEETFHNVFYANLNFLGYYQSNDYSILVKTGMNSQKLGAFIQNTLHDGAGLNPRFPWNTNVEDKLFYELGVTGFKTMDYEN